MRQGERPGIGASGAGLSDAHGDTSMKPLPRKVRGALVVLEVGLAALIGVAAGLGALLCAATITARPPLFVLTGLIAFCATYLLGLWLATRKVDAFRKRRVRVDGPAPDGRPAPSPEMRSSTPARTASTTAPGPRCTAAASLRDPSSTASASTPTSTPSRPRGSPTRTSCPT